MKNDKTIDGKKDGWFLKLIGSLLLVGVGFLIYKQFDLNTTITNLKDQTTNLTKFLERKYPNDFVPNVLANKIGLQPLGDNSFVYASHGELTQEAKAELSASGYTAVSIPITENIKTSFEKIGGHFNKAYFLINERDVSNKPEKSLNKPKQKGLRGD